MIPDWSLWSEYYVLLFILHFWSAVPKGSNGKIERNTKVGYIVSAPSTIIKVDGKYNEKLYQVTENILLSHPETRGWGGVGSYSKKLGELSLVDFDSTQREEHAYIGHSSGCAKFFELGGFECWNFYPKISLFRL